MIRKISMTCVSAFLVIACGGAEPTSEDPGDKTPPSDEDPGDETPNPTPDPEEEPEEAPDPDFDVSARAPGLSSSVAATIDGASDFVWTLVDQPEGSELETADLDDADTSEVSFRPNHSGKYELEVSYSWGGETLTKSVTVTVKGYPIPFVAVDTTTLDVGYEVTGTPRVADSGQAGARDIGCPRTNAFATENDATNHVLTLANNATVHVPQRPSERARVAMRLFDESGGLVLSNSTTTCDAEDERVVEGGPVPAYAFPMQFSPNGARLLVPVDGEESDALFSVASEDGGANYSVFQRNISWGAHFTWSGAAEITGVDLQGEQRLIVRAADAEDAGDGEQETVVECADLALDSSMAYLTQIASAGDHLVALKGGSVIRMDAVEGAFDCDVASEQNVSLSGELTVSSFDVNDDGTTIAFVALGEDGRRAVFIVPVDGSSAAEQVSPVDGTDHLGARFALGGEQLVWLSNYDPATMEETVDEDLDFGNVSVTRVFRANANGSLTTEVHREARGEGEPAAVTAGSTAGMSCSFGTPIHSGGLSGLLAGVLGLGLLARRRRTAS